MPSSSQGTCNVNSSSPSAPTRDQARDNLMLVRNFLASLPPERFDMGDWGDGADVECGTAACIGGWAERLLFGELYGRPTWLVGAEMGLSIDQSEDLFFLVGKQQPGLDFQDITTAHAVKVLDHLIATGEVDWSKALPDGSEATKAGNSGMNK